ncbi:MAG: hypothetical protein JSW39_30280 [Desulfobacterales bacterium]|nr:MAG: hypothetical protein JSW39_30280 [Desulfobacterales bacterium]
MGNSLIHGVFDMHVHSHPDNAPRKTDDIELATAAAKAGMGGLVLKAHQGSTVERAYLVQKAVGNIRVFGGLVLNYPVGGLNPNAVDYYVRLGAREVWMPSLSADYMVTYMKGHVAVEDRVAFNKAHGGASGGGREKSGTGEHWPWTRQGRGISILDEKNKLVDEVLDILEILAASEAILSTGHLSIPETFALIEAAQKVGVKRLLVTHPEYMAPMGAEDQIRLARKGVFFERCFVFTTEATKTIGGFLPLETIVKNIRAVGVESTVLGTDFGQATNQHPVTAMMDYLTQLTAAGFNEREIERMAVKNPAALLNV